MELSTAETARQQPAGLAPRAAAAALLAGVVDRRESLDTLLDDKTGLSLWRGLDPRDRGLARAITTTALRHRGRIDAIIRRLADRPPPRRARHLSNALHVASAQILFMDVPQSAAVNLAVAALSSEPRSARFAGFANAILRRMCREKDQLLEGVTPGARTAFPDWLARQLIRDHGRGKADAIAAMVACEPVIDLTPHPRLDPGAVERLTAEIGAHALPTGSLRLPDNRPIPQLPGFDDGAWWVQDAAASVPARLLGDVSGLRVADLCAAPGGKTAQLAASGAHVTAVDVSGARLARLSDNLDRLGLSAEIVEADILDWQPDTLFDAVLLDAPCSATGTMRRHPDIAWNKLPEDVETLAGLQKRLVDAALRLVRPGGTLVYANCSVLKREGEDLLAALLRERGDLSVSAVAPTEIGDQAGWINGQGAFRTLPCDLPADPPGRGGVDGFFAARLRIPG